MKSTISYDYQIFAFQSYGGVSRYFYELCARLKSQSEGVLCPSIYAPLHVNQYIEKLAPGQLHSIGAVKPFRGSSLALRLIDEGISHIRNRIYMPDLIHETYYSRRTVAPKNCPIVLTVYDMVHELFAQNFRLNDSTTNLKRIAVERADHIICISESTKQDLMQLFGTDERKISVTHLGFSIDNEKIIDENDRSKLNGKPFILHVGSRAGYKNFSTLLQAYAASAQLRKDYDLISFSATTVNTDEMAMLQKLGIQDNVHFVSGNDRQLAQYYQAATIFVYPSLYEGFGIPPLEAMHFGCPVACSNTSSIPEVVGAAAKLFDPSSSESIRAAMEELVSGKDVRDLHIELGYERLKMFSWDKCAYETSNIYKELLL
jgi:glycosyltransferase involved in cell wall biosynthesis